MPGQVNDGGNPLDVTLLEPHRVVAVIMPINWPPSTTRANSKPPVARLGQGLAVIAGLQRRDLVRVLAHRRGDLPQPLAGFRAGRAFQAKCAS
jgi:hypothetical protein